MLSKGHLTLYKVFKRKSLGITNKLEILKGHHNLMSMPVFNRGGIIGSARSLHGNRRPCNGSDSSPSSNNYSYVSCNASARSDSDADTGSVGRPMATV